MRDKSTGITISFAIIALVFGLAFLVNGVIGGQLVASSDVVARQSAPTVNDDIDRGFLPGYTWVDQSASKTYIAISTSDGVAVWNQTNINNTTLGSEYGNLFATDAATAAQVLATAGAFEKVIAYDQAGASTANVVVSAASQNVTITQAGDYLLTYNSSYSGVANKEYDLAIFLDGVIQPASKTHRTLGAAGAVGVVAGASIIASLTSGQVVDVRAAPETNGNQITVVNGSLIVVQLPE